MNPWNDPTMQKIAGLIALGVILVIFLVCREFVCWYFKINLRQSEMETQSAILRKILASMEKGAPQDAPAIPLPDDAHKE